jgi:hypothetical protein
MLTCLLVLKLLMVIMFARGSIWTFVRVSFVAADWLLMMFSLSSLQWQMVTFAPPGNKFPKPTELWTTNC